ncbi:MAG: restriction endonuclease subunit S [Anaerovoracaceae bacterium]|nr:restriction endonuclease subunit S [Bacillota bacterium]MDY2670233.1 restriction endonuclease subunit S [Anaerovoracaceae bacterium]
MREMKDSGYAFINEIPADWIITKAKLLLKNVSEKNHPNATVLSLYRDLGVIPKNSRDDNYNVTSEKTENYKYVRKNDLVINKMKAWQGSLAVSDYKGIVSPAYYVCSFITNKINKRYFHYLIRNKMYAQEFGRLSTGMRIGQWDLAIDDFLDTPILIPPLDLQKRIAAYLDSKCDAIDEVISSAKASIEDYKALKQSIITEAVTKGLDPDVELKDSGVAWIGKIPNNITVSHIGMHAKIILGKMICSKPVNDTYTLEPYYSAIDVHFDGIADLERKQMWFSPLDKDMYEVHQGDLLIVEGGAGAGGCCIAPITKQSTYIQNSIMIVRSNKNMMNEFIKYCLESFVKRGYVDYVCNKATIPHFTKEKLSKTPIPIFPIKEQKKIVEFLDKKCNTIDVLIRQKEKTISDLEAYKKSLIYEVVTGKREVV